MLPYTRARDAAGRLWSTERKMGLWGFPNDNVHVDVEGQHLSMADALQEAGRPEVFSRIFGALGRGKRIIVCAWAEKSANTGVLYLADIHEGRIRLQKVPRHPNVFPDDPPMRLNDSDGSLWISARLLQDYCIPGFSLVESYSFRVGENGIDRQPVDCGRPLLLDHAGNVWFERDEGVTCTFELHRNGRLVQELTIPHTDRIAGLVTHRRGSVYAFVSGGLLHLQAEGPEFNDYKPAELYELTGIRGRVSDIMEVGRDWIAVYTTEEDYSEKQAPFHLVKLPVAGEPFPFGKQ